MVLVIEYGAGNVASVRNSLLHLGHEPCVGSQPELIQRCRTILLPGVGDGAYMMRRLNELGLVEPLQRWAKEGNPLLGICVGAQVLLSSTEEGNADCLDIIKGRCRKFVPREGANDKIPHMGWNSIDITRPVAALKGMDSGTDFYFVHSYYFDPAQAEHRVAKTDYIHPFASIIGRENVLGVQFHPEKSGESGLRLLANFLSCY